MADEIVITKTVEEKIDLRAMREEIKRINAHIDWFKALSEKEKVKLFDAQMDMQGWIDEKKRLKALLNSYDPAAGD